MIGMRELLEEMVAKGASDLHLTAGIPPQYRVDGLIHPFDIGQLLLVFVPSEIIDKPDRFADLGQSSVCVIGP